MFDPFVKDERWRQPTPQMEYTCILMALTGQFDNWDNEIIKRRRFANAAHDLLKQLRALEPFLYNPEKWNENAGNQ